MDFVGRKIKIWVAKPRLVLYFYFIFWIHTSFNFNNQVYCKHRWSYQHLFIHHGTIIYVFIRVYQGVLIRCKWNKICHVNGNWQQWERIEDRIAAFIFFSNNLLLSLSFSVSLSETTITSKEFIYKQLFSCDPRCRINMNIEEGVVSLWNIWIFIFKPQLKYII